MRGAVARLAETAYERLDPERRVVARTIFLRLAGEGEGEAAVRRRVPLGEFEGEREGAAAVLAALADDRLVTIGEGEVEVAHEALLREWPRLRGWLEEDAEGRRVHRHLADAARDWDAGGPRPRRAVSGRAGWPPRWSGSPATSRRSTTLEREFIDASRAAMEGRPSATPCQPAPARAARRRRRPARAGRRRGRRGACTARRAPASAALVADAQRLGAAGPHR